MSVASPISFMELEVFLHKVRTELPPNAEKTILAVSGVGRNENRVSDLLGFFLHPEEAHGFGTLFLEVFFRCLEANQVIGPTDRVSVSREVTTHGDTRIDLLVKGLDWVLLIENKIGHQPNNPFADYESLADSICGEGSTHLMILSPAGDRATSERWVPVSYLRLAAELERTFETRVFEAAAAKWQILARDFVQHARANFYQRNDMITEHEIDLIEGAFLESAHVHRIYDNYLSHLSSLAVNRLKEALPGYSFRFEDAGFGIRLTSPSWPVHLVLRTPAHMDARSFSVRVYPGILSRDQRSRVNGILAGFSERNPGEKDQYYDLPAPNHLTTGHKAIERLCAIARELASVWPTTS